MRNILILIIMLMATCNAFTQTQVQRGIARMITRSVNDPVVPVAGVQVVVGNVANKASDNNGRFSMDIAVNKEQSYSLTDVRLPKGSKLMLASPSKKKKLFLDKNDLVVSLISKDEKDMVSKANYDKLREKYRNQTEKVFNLRNQLDEKLAELNESSKEYAIVKAKRDSVQKLLSLYDDDKIYEQTLQTIAEDLAMTDYQSLDSIEARIYNLKMEGDWQTISDVLIRLMGGNASAWLHAKLERRNQAAKDFVMGMEMIKEAIESFKMQWLDDSVSYYYALLVKADTTNFENLCEAGRFEIRNHSNLNVDQLAEYPKYELAKDYFQMALRNTEVDTLKAWGYALLGITYEALGQYNLAEKNFFQALDLRKTALGDNDYSVGSVYLSLSILYGMMQDSLKMIKYNQMYVDVEEFNLGKHHPSMANTYQSLARNYFDVGNDIKAEEYYTKAIRAFESQLQYNVYFDYYYNLGTFDFLRIGDYEKVKEYFVNEVKDRMADNYYHIAFTYLRRNNDVKILENCRKALKTGSDNWFQAEYAQDMIDSILQNSRK